MDQVASYLQSTAHRAASPDIRDFKIWYVEAVVRRQISIMKIASGDVMTRVTGRLSRRNLAFYYELLRESAWFHVIFTSEYKPAVYLLKKVSYVLI